MTIESPQNDEAERIEKLKDLILTHKQFSEHPFAHDGSQRAYVFEVTVGNKKLVFFGSSHTNDPEDHLFTEIEEKFKELQPEIVFVEGMEGINKSKDRVRERVTREDVDEVKSEGESHFTLKLGVDAGIDFQSPEPTFSDEIAYLIGKDFSKEDIFRFNIYRNIDQYQRQNKEPSVEACKEYLKPYFGTFRKYSGWSESELDAFEREILETLNIQDRTTYHNQVDPIPWEDRPQTIINEISRNSSDFRDRYIFERIAEALKKYDRLFIVYGSAHAVKQEPAIKALLG